MDIVGRLGRKLTYDGITDSVLGWARRIGVSDVTIQRCLNEGATDVEAIEFAKSIASKRTSDKSAKQSVNKLILDLSDVPIPISDPFTSTLDLFSRVPGEHAGIAYVITKEMPKKPNP